MSLQTNISFYNSRTAMYAVYSLLTLAVFVVVSPYFVYQAIRYKKYIGSLRQRLGFLPISFNIDGGESIWIHAVSLGEARTARGLAAVLPARARRRRSLLHAERRVGPPTGGSGRRSGPGHGHRQPEIRFARSAGWSRARQAARTGDALLPAVAQPDGDRRRQHDARRRNGGPAGLRPRQDGHARRAGDPGAASSRTLRRGRANRARRRLHHDPPFRAAHRRGAAGRCGRARLHR